MGDWWAVVLVVLDHASRAGGVNQIDRTFRTRSGLVDIQAQPSPAFRHAGIDVFLAVEAQGRGIGTNAVNAVVDYLLTDRGHHRLTIDPIVENRPAIRCYEKVGFRAVGVMRQYWRAPDGQWKDGLLMELLAIDRRSRA